MPLDSLLNGCPKINQDTTFDELMRAVSAASYTGKEDDPAYEFRQLFVPPYRST
jgi:hypothetical protein